MIFKLLVAGSLLFLGGCAQTQHPSASGCDGAVECGYFDIKTMRESTPIFFAAVEPSPPYRLCVTEGSIILQTIEEDGNALALGGEISAGNCADISFFEKVYIIGNTATGQSRGYYYRVP